MASEIFLILFRQYCCNNWKCQGKMTLSHRHLSLIIIQKNWCDYYTVCSIMEPQYWKHNYFSLFNLFQCKAKKINRVLRALKEALLNYQKKITLFCRMGQTVVSNSSMSMKNGTDTVTENNSCMRYSLSNRHQQYLFRYTCAVTHAASSEQCDVCVYIYICSCYT